jgi:hypothetical protein
MLVTGGIADGVHALDQVAVRGAARRVTVKGVINRARLGIGFRGAAAEKVVGIAAGLLAARRSLRVLRNAGQEALYSTPGVRVKIEYFITYILSFSHDGHFGTELTFFPGASLRMGLAMTGVFREIGAGPEGRGTPERAGR